MEKSSGKGLMEEKYIKCHLKSLKFLKSQDLNKDQKQLEALYQINFKPTKFEALTLNNLSIIYLKQKNPAKSLATLEIAQKLKTHSPKESLGTYINLSSAASALSNHPEALNFALQAKQLLHHDPKLSPIVHFNIAVEFMHLNLFQESEKHLKNAFSDINESHDPALVQLLYSLQSFLSSLKPRDTDANQSKHGDSKIRKKVLKKVSSGDSIPSKLKNAEKTFKRSESLIQVSSRTIISSHKPSTSNTSSTESINNISGQMRTTLSTSKTIRKIIKSKTSNRPFNTGKVENRIQSIGEHLSTIERKLNDFVDLCKPLLTLTEDPDEQLDSQRHLNSTEGSVMMQKLLAAICIQRAWRKYRNERIMKRTLLKFRDNPLFRQSGKVIKGKKG